MTWQYPKGNLTRLYILVVFFLQEKASWLPTETKSWCNARILIPVRVYQLPHFSQVYQASLIGILFSYSTILSWDATNEAIILDHFSCLLSCTYLILYSLELPLNTQIKTAMSARIDISCLKEFHFWICPALRILCLLPTVCQSRRAQFRHVVPWPLLARGKSNQCATVLRRADRESAEGVDA